MLLFTFIATAYTRSIPRNHKGVHNYLTFLFIISFPLHPPPKKKYSPAFLLNLDNLAPALPPPLPSPLPRILKKLRHGQNPYAFQRPEHTLHFTELNLKKTCLLDFRLC